MKLINPIHMIIYIAVWLTTAYLVRGIPSTLGSVVGWRSKCGYWQAYYDASRGAVGVVTPKQHSAWKLRNPLNVIVMVKAYVRLLDQVTAAFINYNMKSFVEESHNDRR